MRAPAIGLHARKLVSRGVDKAFWAAGKQALLNVGCGARFHPAWINVDLAPASPEVRAHDIRRGLPYDDCSFDACYSSHVLEHLQRHEARALLGEMHRVLKPGGVVRCVVPDLEGIAIAYLAAVADVHAGKYGANANHEWMLIELYDQAVRGVPGGEMSRYLNRASLPNAAFVRSRLGDFPADAGVPRTKPSVWARVRRNGLRGIARRLRWSAARLLVRAVAGPKAQTAFDESVFRSGGEIHRWMYDRYSLGRVLESVGFADARVCTAIESRIPSFVSYGLDSTNSRPHIPQSLFMEALKP